MYTPELTQERNLINVLNVGKVLAQNHFSPYITDLRLGRSPVYVPNVGMTSVLAPDLLSIREFPLRRNHQFKEFRKAFVFFKYNNIREHLAGSVSDSV